MDNFIPKMYDSKQVTIRIKEDKLEQMDKCIQNYSLNRSSFINLCIDYAMAHLPDAMPNDEKE